MSPRYWTTLIAYTIGNNQSGAYRCGPVASILAQILSLSGYRAVVCSGHVGEVSHVWVEVDGVVYDPTAAQFVSPVYRKEREVQPFASPEPQASNAGAIKDRDSDIATLLSNLRWLEEATGEELEDEDAALVRAIEADLATRRAALTTPEPQTGGRTTCERCQGNGEIVTDWYRYKHGQPGDKGDEAVAECPDCNGSGEVEPHTGERDREDEAYEIGKRDGYEKAVQELDERTGGDGEYCCVAGDSSHERHCPDPASMSARIVARYEAERTAREAAERRLAEVEERAREDTARLNWLEANPSASIAKVGGWDCTEGYRWSVQIERGNRNDREWDEVGSGETARAALDAALRAKPEAQGKEGD